MRYSLFIFSLLLSYPSFSQNIPNGDFESWEIRDHYRLDWWYSPARNVQRINQAADGRFGLKLSNTTNDSLGASGFVQNVNPSNLNEFNGFPYDDGPLSLVFWNKHNLALGDTAQILAVFKDDRKTVGTVDFKFFGDSEEEYLKYTVPIQWTAPSTPDSVWIYLTSCISDSVNGEGFVIFDDIYFDFAGSRTTEIPNSSFENWTNIGVEFPSDWRSVNLLIYDTYSSFFEGQSVFRITELRAYEGGSSLMIKNYNHFGSLASGYSFVGTTNEHFQGQSFNIDRSYQYLEGYYKYLSKSSDSGRILFQSWSDDERTSYNNYFFQPTEKWTYFAFPLSYTQTDLTPNKASLTAWSSDILPTHLNSEMYLDNLKLVTKPNTTASSQSELPQQINLYPNPCKYYLQVPISTTYSQIIPLNSLVQQFELILDDGRADVSHLPNGVYTLYL